MVKPDKRESLLRAAETLFHRKGLEHTSLADIADAAAVPLGNVYYYFKTRGDLVKGVSGARQDMLRARREEWARLPDPRDRLLAYVKAFEANDELCTAHGCPMGSLCVEANKQGGAIAEEAASVMRGTLDWLAAQFRDLGFREPQAREHAARVLGGRQGSIILSNTFKDPQYIRLETARLKQWLAGLPARKQRKSK